MQKFKGRIVVYSNLNIWFQTLTILKQKTNKQSNRLIYEDDKLISHLINKLNLNTYIK